MWGIALAMGLMTTPESAQAQSVDTALEVQSWCKSFADVKAGANESFAMPRDPRTELCWGAFLSIQQMSAIIDGNGRRVLSICPPASSTRIEYIEIFLRYAEQHPAEGEQAFAGVARRALAGAFPCP
jgi:hypothetical protein